MNRSRFASAFAASVGLCLFANTTASESLQNPDNRQREETVNIIQVAPEPLVREPPEPRSYQAICERALNLDEADLCQQWRSAIAAEKTADFASRSYDVSFWSAIGLFLTLLATAWAAIASSKAARSAERGVAIAEDTAKRQLRAYVSVNVSAVDGVTANAQLRATFTMRNHGQTPAYSLRQGSRIVIWPYPLPADWPFPEIDIEGAPSVATLHASEQKSGHAHSLGPVPLDQLVAAAEGTRARIYLIGQVSYRDAFGQRRNTRFCTSLIVNDWQLAVHTWNNAQTANLTCRPEAAAQHNEET